MNVLNPNATTAATSVHLGSYSAGGNLTFNNIVYGAQTTKSRSSSIVSRWLAEHASANQYAIQKETLEKVAPGTCSWILERPEFDSWMAGKTRSFWGVGIPGAGKTILSSFVIRQLQERTARLHSGSLVAFAYCRYNDKLSVFRILAALLQQLVDSSGAVEDRIFETLYSICNKQYTKPTPTELKAALEESARLVPRIFFVIDSLDELSEDVRDEVMDILVSLQHSLFVTSRELHLEQIPHPNMYISAPKRDFETFISGEIQRLPRLRSLLRTNKEVLLEVVDHIAAKSDGMFLLSSLQISALGGVTNIRSLRNAIQALPTTLTGMYEVTLARIRDQSEEECSLALRAFLWATHSVLPLESAQLRSALAVDSDSTELDPYAVVDERTLISVCCGLLAINEETRIVRLIHYTTHDFFKSYREAPFDDPHTFAATICAVYRDLTSIDEVNHGEKIVLLVQQAMTHPFIGHTVYNLGHHTHESALLHDGRIPPRVQKFLSEHQSIHIPLSYRHWDYGSAVHFAALHGLLRWFEECRDVAALNKLSYDQKASPLIYACKGDQMRVAKFLLETGAVGVNAEDYEGCTALGAAARIGSINLVELLLQSGASVLAGSGALKEGCTHGQPEITRLFLSHPLVQGTICDELNKCLLAETIRSNIGNTDETVELLLNIPGIDINLPLASDSSTPLMCAMQRNDFRIAIRLLGLPDINYNARNNEGLSALHLAATNCGFEDAVARLLEFPDLDINAKDRRGRNALHFACRWGNIANLTHLLRPGKLDVNAKETENGWTPLHYATCAEWDRVECVQILLGSGLGLDIDAVTWKDQFGKPESSTALDLARRLVTGAEVAALLETAGARTAAEVNDPLPDLAHFLALFEDTVRTSLPPWP